MAKNTYDTVYAEVVTAELGHLCFVLQIPDPHSRLMSTLQHMQEIHKYTHL